MRLIDADVFDKVLADAQNKCKKSRDNFRYGFLSTVRANMMKQPTIHAVPVDKLFELFEGDGMSCRLCEKIMPEWCKENNNFPLTWDKELKCPKWERLLSKWLEEMIISE